MITGAEAAHEPIEALACRFDPAPGGVERAHPGLPNLAGPGFRLREPRLADAGQLAAAFEPEACVTMGVASPGASDDWLQFVAEVRLDRAARHTMCWAVVPDGSVEVTGLVLLRRVAPRSRVTTLSFVASAPQWRTTLTARSVACALAYAFEACGVERIEGRAADARELALVRSLGAVAEGVLRGSQRDGRRRADQMLWSVLKTEWEQHAQRVSAESVRVEREQPPSGDALDAGRIGAPSWTTNLPTLKGRVVTLREVELLDASVLLRALDRVDVETSIEPAPTTLQEFRRYIAWIHLQRMLGRAAGFVIVPRGTRHAAGLVQIRREDRSGGVAEWGIVVASPLRGTGAAGEAARLLAGFAFDALGVDRLEARASGIDPISPSLLRSLGAVREAHLRESFARGNEVLDDDLWTIFESDWRSAHAPHDSERQRPVPARPA